MILVISSSSSLGAVYTNALRFFGLIAYQEVPTRALSEISPATSAVLIISPHLLADEADFVKRIKSYNKSVPVFAIRDAEHSAYELCIPSAASGSEAYLAMQDYMKSVGLKPLGLYKLAGLDVSIGQRVQSYSFLDIKFTETELFILRYLIKTFPIRQGARDIIKYAYPKSALSSDAVIRTHISKINRKFEALTGRYLINSVSGEGYIIDTPIKPEIYKRR